MVRREDMLKPGDVIGGLVLLGVSAWAIIGGVKLHLGKVSEPQPGFFPFWGGVVLALLSGILLLKTWAAPRGAGKGGESFGAIWRPMVMIIGLIAYVAFLKALGYLIATFALCIVLLRVLGTKRVRGLLFAALCIAFGSYILFARLLNVTLPNGILAQFL